MNSTARVVVYDIEGNQREVVDALGRAVMRYDYDMLGAGQRSHASTGAWTPVSAGC